MLDGWLGFTASVSQRKITARKNINPTGLLAFKTADQIRSDDALYYLAGIDNARFKKPVEPGDQLRLEVKLIKNKRNLWKFYAQATVDGDVVVSADIMCVNQEMPS